MAAVLGVLLIISSAALFGNQRIASAQSAPVSGSELGASSGSNRFVVWQDAYGTGLGDIYFKRSSDDGATWKASVNLSKNPGLSYFPKIAVSGTHVYVAWTQRDADDTSQDVFLRRSTDNGATWSAKTKVFTGTGCIAAGTCHNLQELQASGSNVYVVTMKDSLQNNYYFADIFLRRSADNGATWKTAVNISSNAGNSFDPDLALSGSNVYLTWTQENTARTSIDIFFRRSTDGGATWKSKVNLSNDPGLSQFPDIAASGSNVYVSWQGDVTYPDGRTFYGAKLRNSNDGGATWASVKSLSDYPVGDISGDQRLVGALHPQIVASGSSVYMAWFDNVILEEKASGSMDAVFRRSLDGGNTWDPVLMVDHANPSEGCPQIELAVSGTTAYLAWLISNEGCNNWSVEFSRSRDNGASWSASRSMADVFNSAGVGPAVNLAVSNSSVFKVVSREMGGPGSDIFVARSTDSGQNWGLATNLSKLSGISVSPQIAV